MSSINFDYDAANERLSEMVLDSEDVVATIEGADGNKRMRSRFVLTDKRLLRFEDNVVGDETDVYRLDNISSVDYSTGLIKNKLTIEGSGIDSEFNLDASDSPESFVRNLRELTL